VRIPLPDLCTRGTARAAARGLLACAGIMTPPNGFPASAISWLSATLPALAMLTACGLDGEEPPTSEVSSASTVASFITTSCTTAVVLGLSSQISDEIGCMSPGSLVRFGTGSGITFTSNAVLPFLAPNAKTDLQAVGDVQLNSAFRTIAQQYLIVQWFNRGLCGIAAAAPVGQSNHESGRAVDLQNASSRVTAMANHGWAHDVSGDPVHFDHLSSPDIRGKDTLAFQRLWNRNHPADLISTDGIYGPQTEARLVKSPATGFTTGATCTALAAVRGSEVVAIDGPDRVAPGARAHYRITINNTTGADWPETTRLVVADGSPSPLYDAASWTSSTEIGEIGAAIPAGTHGVVELDVVAPNAGTPAPVSAELALTDGTTQVATVPFAVTVTPDSAVEPSGDSGDHLDGTVSGGCAAGGGAGWLGLLPVLLVLRRRR
jgi:hypothetical protein